MLSKLRRPKRRQSRPRQLEFPKHGGRRDGAGRKPGNKVTHHARPAFTRPTPVHVTLRIENDIPSLRSSRRFAAIRRSFKAARGLHGLRLVHFTVLSNHLHLIVEADGSAALATGMQGLNVRLAKALNGVLARKGKVFADHYHGRLLLSPTEVRNALDYVQNNAQHHYGEKGADRFSSAAADAVELLARPLTWLLEVGWLRARRRRPCSS
jgi:REP element-mobilizing transposase RayT